MPAPEDNHPLRHQLGQPSPSHTPNAMHAAPQSRRQAPADRSEMTRPASAAAHRAPTATATGQSGTVGENIQWKLENGTLTFSGEGEVQEIVDWTEVAPQVTDVVFEEGITGICAYFFYGIGYFGQVVSLSLPASVTHIDAYAFWDFHNLQTTTIAGITPPRLDPNAFYIWHTLVVPDGYSQAYYNVEPWYWFNITDPGTFACGDGLTCIYNALDHYLEVYGEGPMWADVDLVRGHEADIQWIYFAEGVTSLADGAFQNLSLIEYINVPLSFEQIGSYAFAGDAQLREINLPRRVESIGKGAFQNCSSLEYISCQSAVAPQLGEDALTSVAETGTLAVPEGSDYSSWISQLPEGWTVQYTNSVVEGQCGEQVFWSFDNTTGELAITGEGPMESAPWGGYSNIIESVEIDNGITSLAPHAFQICIYLRTISIPKSVITFGEDSYGQGFQFAYCSSLTSVTFESGSLLTNIPSYTFYGCEALQSITIPKSVTTFGEDSHGQGYQFCDCYSLSSVVFEEGSQLTNIPSYAFNNCQALQSITIPKSVTTFGENSDGYGYQFSYCSSLNSVTFEEGSQLTNIPSFAFSWCNNLQSITIPKSVTSFGEDSYGQGHQFDGCSSLNSVTFEEGSQLTNIPSYAFCYCNNLQSITIPKSVTTFGENYNGRGGQFASCSSLNSVTFEEGSQLINIPSSAFSSCQALQSITIPKSVTSFGEDSNGQGGQFAYCSSLNSVLFETGSQLTNIPSYAFSSCQALQSITIPKSVTTFGEDYNGYGRQFSNCSSLTSVIFEDGSQLTNIPSYAFYYCRALQSITIPKSVTTFGETSDGYGYQFYCCLSLNSVTFESGSQLTNIPSHAFFQCEALQSITIPKSVTTFGEGSNGQGVQFAYCSSLSSVTFESGSLLTNIPSYAFYYCEALLSITIPKSVTTFGEDYNGNGRQFYYCSSLSSVTFEAGSQLTNIPSYAFFGCETLQSITIPKSVKVFGKNYDNGGAQFYGCSSLTSVKFEDDSQLEELPNWTFGWCTALKSITIPKSVTSFGQDYINGWGCQFCACDSLQTVIFEEGSKLTEIASHAFEGCVSLQSIKIPNSVTTFTTDINNVGSQFNWCESLTSVEFEKGSRLTELPSYAFNECYLLESITIPKSVVAFGTTTDGYGWGGQFSDCQSLRDVTFEQGSQLANISAYAFNNCYSLQSITALTNEVPSLSTEVFAGLPETGILTTHAGKDFSSWMEQLPEGWTLIQKNMTGDLDGDGEVSISDAVGIINFIIHSATEGLNEQAADMNGDGVISIADAVMAVNTVLHISGAAANSRRLPMADVDATLAMSPMTVAKSTAVDLPVILNGAANAYTALQSTLHLPQGVALTAVTSADGHAVHYAEQEDGSICIVSLSLSNATFAGNGDAIFILHLQTDDTFEGGLVMLDEMEIVMPSLHASHPSAVGALLTEGATTIGNIPMMDGEHTEYDLSGRVGQGTQGVYIEKGKKYYRK